MITDGECSILRQVLRCRFPGNSKHRGPDLLGSFWRKSASVFVREVALSWVHKPRLRREIGFLGESLDSRRDHGQKKEC